MQIALQTAASAGSQAVVVAPAADLAEYITQGPLVGSCGLSADGIRAQLSAWEELGRTLALQLNFDPAALDDTQRMRIYHYYLPVYFWVNSQLRAHAATGASHALVVGISAPQGCGKTTLVEQLQQLFTATGRATASVSIDDFYLTFQDQSALAARHPDNPLLQYRGNAGTHDLALGTQTLETLRSLRQPGQEAAVPRYDKSAHAGRGDRAAVETWPKVQAPVDLVLFEGWMSGFRPVSEAQASAVHPGLPAVNAALQHYQAAWDAQVDCWLVVRIGDPKWVFQWRQQAEVAMRAKGLPGMTDSQVADFVDRFMPAYQAYLPDLYAKGPTTGATGRTLVIEVDKNRSPVMMQPVPCVGSVPHA